MLRVVTPPVHQIPDNTGSHKTQAGILPTAPALTAASGKSPRSSSSFHQPQAKTSLLHWRQIFSGSWIKLYLLNNQQLIGRIMAE